MMNTGDKNVAITPDHIQALVQNDQSYTNLISFINQGFPSKHSLTEPDICNIWKVRHWLITDRRLVLMDGRIVIPKFLKAWMVWKLVLTIQFIGMAWPSPYTTLEWLSQFVQPLPQSSHRNSSPWLQPWNGHSNKYHVSHIPRERQKKHCQHIVNNGFLSPKIFNSINTVSPKFISLGFLGKIKFTYFSRSAGYNFPNNKQTFFSSFQCKQSLLKICIFYNKLEMSFHCPDFIQIH